MQIFIALFPLADDWNQDEHENNGRAFTVQQLSGCSGVVIMQAEFTSSIIQVTNFIIRLSITITF
jgi:hypothetical protein